MKALFLIGRTILGGFFLYNGINHIKNKEALAHYARAKNLPNPELAVVGSGVLLAAAGASLMLGLKPQLGALSVVGFLIPASTQFHDFWNEQDPQGKQQQQIHFAKNMALVGAALALAGIEDWPLSVG